MILAYKVIQTFWPHKDRFDQSIDVRPPFSTIGHTPVVAVLLRNVGKIRT